MLVVPRLTRQNAHSVCERKALRHLSLFGSPLPLRLPYATPLYVHHAIDIPTPHCSACARNKQKTTPDTAIVTATTTTAAAEASHSQHSRNKIKKRAGAQTLAMPVENDSQSVSLSDECTTPRYIPCRARYALAAAAVLVEFTDEDESE
jgi:hypothetical protein